MEKKLVSTKEWMITMFIQFIPVMNIIMLFLWAFGSDTIRSKANWAKASLVYMVSFTVLNILFLGSILTFIGSMSDEFNSEIYGDDYEEMYQEDDYSLYEESGDDYSAYDESEDDYSLYEEADDDYSEY